MPCTTSIAADAFLWSSNGFQDLHHLSGDDQSIGYVVNDSGVVVSSSANTTTGVYHGFVWTNPGPMVGLPDLPGGSGYTFATAITSKGVIVGESATSNGDEHVVLWTKCGGMEGPGDIEGRQQLRSLAQQFGHGCGRLHFVKVSQWSGRVLEWHRNTPHRDAAGRNLECSWLH